ncbi:hypothetical protein FNAPI_1671 [Fusarium napiforme]|uniref:NACHT domain-containing protein n=1 Tax=Fusarium napiforme TaxID=42672 RepID=A0A8H5NG38_9HYPO|nr:hypothetical protein FNAPI_1671 [Fusarium napiforme]
MLTGFEALGAASAVLQVISFAADVAVACKSAYDGATTSQDDLQRYAGQMSEAVDRVHTRCEQMRNANSKFASPKLQNIAKECKDTADKLEAEVQCVTRVQAQGDILKSIRKAFRASSHRKKLQALQESLSKYQQVMEIELTSHLCSQSDAINLQQDVSFGKLDTDVQFLVNQLAQGITDIKNLVKREHVATRSAITQEGARAEAAINSHTDSQVLELRTTAETKRKCETFLQSLKAPRMNQRYNDVMDSRDASFNQVFATYEDMKAMYGGDSEDSGHSTDDSEDDADTGDDTEEIESESYQSSDAASDMDNIYDSWFSFNSWLKSNDKLFYIQGKPGSGKSTLVKFILNQDQTRDFIQEWSPNAIIIFYFFWKIGSEEQNSIKGLWCSLLYQRLQDQQQLILSTLQQFSHLSLHSEFHDWSIKDLQDVWNYIVTLDTRHVCMFIDGLDEVRDQDGFSKLSQSIQLISRPPRTKLCVSARPEAQIVRWLRTTDAAGILLEDLTRFDMLQFVRNRFRQLLPNSQVSWETSQDLRRELVNKAQGVFLWLHLATRSIIDGVENNDSEEMLFARLHALPGGIEDLYIDLWQRMNAKSPVYVETARRYFRYVLQASSYPSFIGAGREWRHCSQPWIMQIACAEDSEIQEKLLRSKGTVELTEILRKCEETKTSIQSRCAGLLEVRPEKEFSRLFESLGDDNNAFSEVAFIHRTAHDFLTDTEAGQGILGCGPLPDLSTDTRLLHGYICAVMFLAYEWTLSCTSSHIIEQIVDFAKSWGRESLPVATEMLDTVRPLYDRKSIRSWPDPWVPSEPFLSQLTQHDLFDEFVISHLATETSPVPATSVLRKGWSLEFSRRLSRRLFYALINLGADPHEYGISHSPSESPFAEKETAFTNLLLSFIFSSKNPYNYRKNEGDELHRQKLLETLEIAIHMATTCQNLDKAVLLFTHIGDGYMQILTLVDATLGFPIHSNTSSLAVLEVSIQFLLLYMISKVGGDLINSVLTVPQAQDALSRVDSPLVKIRYIRLHKTKDNDSEQEISPHRTFQRILPQVPMPRSDIELLFGMDFERPSQELCEPLIQIEDSPDIDVITKYVNDNETEEVEVEDMMTSLAAENLGICRCEEAGIIPSYEYLREQRENNYFSWRWFPLAIGRLEAIAATREGIEGYR